MVLLFSGQNLCITATELGPPASPGVTPHVGGGPDCHAIENGKAAAENKMSLLKISPARDTTQEQGGWLAQGDGV